MSKTFNALALALILGLTATSSMAWQGKLMDNQVPPDLAHLVNVGNTDAMNELGMRFMQGNGVGENSRKAIELFRKAAVMGNQYAQLNLGILYLNGYQRLKKDEAEAIKWLSKAAKQDNVDAQIQLANLFDSDRTKADNVEKALSWYKKAAELGSHLGMYNVGVYFNKGIGVKQNYAEAIKWYEQSAELGNLDALFNLGALYANGQGVTKNPQKAKEIFSEGCAKGDKQACTELKKI